MVLRLGTARSRASRGFSLASSRPGGTPPKLCGLKIRAFVILIITVGTILILGAAIPSWWISHQLAVESELTTYPVGNSLTELKEMDLILLEVVIDGVEPGVLETSALIEVSTRGAFSDIDYRGVVYLPDADYLSVEMGAEHSFVLAAGNSFADQQAHFVLEPKLPLFDYPFDEYASEFEIRASKVNVSSTRAFEALPVGVAIVGQVQGWEHDVEIETMEDNAITLKLRYKRSESVEAMAIFVCALMWFAALSLFAMTVLQMPTVGVGVDFLCYFWVLLITVAAAVTTIVLAIRSGEGYKMLTEEAAQMEQSGKGKKVDSETPIALPSPISQRSPDTSPQNPMQHRLSASSLMAPPQVRHISLRVEGGRERDQSSERRPSDAGAASALRLSAPHSHVHTVGFIEAPVPCPPPPPNLGLSAVTAQRFAIEEAPFLSEGGASPRAIGTGLLKATQSPGGVHSVETE
uniref:Transmembrane protein n=1 Tax=Chromera velia CCMP2878 TaxID=1169474 RepID=A0A0G4GMX0_9ALVE|eukprot:Cvel_22585.t1-p1 / transcript=Cvel_22585.t1 / gene=Cvel_22585 / organism=Chromera_velia_CCMP2878 / gene_product=hypothetical protein / transcript_product=hypothetical protein / location=Cvel_scaffold2233:16625-21323(-) / protein_length=463 / sequence_SO=supercontig / SO=protein_coding / is_pseudo=false